MRGKRTADHTGIISNMRINLIFIIMISAMLFFVHGTNAQEPSPTFDPFASGSFYIEITPEPVPDPSENRFGKDNAEMVFIPSGSFTMGSDESDALTDTRPAHEVYLDGYWIDKYEVTNAQFARCVEAGYCYEPRDLSSSTHKDYYINDDYANFPVIHVDWNQAKAYCFWAGKRLPTEAEWEKAARGDGSFIYPWGNELPAEIPMQVGLFGSGDTAPVDAFPEGNSPYGAYNVGGNVWEWTADQYDQYFYSKSPAENPKAVTGGNDYVIRGFSWAYPFSRHEITTRNFSYILNHSYDLGFRCALSE